MYLSWKSGRPFMATDTSVSRVRSCEVPTLCFGFRVNNNIFHWKTLRDSYDKIRLSIH